jgi:hypothetical protein
LRGYKKKVEWNLLLLIIFSKFYVVCISLLIILNYILFTVL